jgi:pimeloyl-ACP methyl ester carboxylesterase
MPGFGTSPAGKPVMKLDETARSIIRALDDRNITQPAVFTGLSMGGYVLFQVLRFVPMRVRAAVLCSTRSAADTPEGKEKRMQNVALVEKEGVGALAEKMIPSLLGESTRQTRPEIADRVRASIKKQPAAAVTAALKGMAERGDTTTVLSGIACPALVVSGTEDTVIPTAEMEEMGKKIPKGEFQAIEKAGHLLNLEAPDRFNDIFLHFLKRRVL